MADIWVYRAVGSAAPQTGLYQHTACTYIGIFAEGNIFALCGNPSCPNKGANWILKEFTATVAL